MSIAYETLRLQTAKADIIDALEAKGVTVPAGTKMDGLAALIGDIATGGADIFDAVVTGMEGSAVQVINCQPRVTGETYTQYWTQDNIPYCQKTLLVAKFDGFDSVCILVLDPQRYIDATDYSFFQACQFGSGPEIGGSAICSRYPPDPTGTLYCRVRFDIETPVSTDNLTCRYVAIPLEPVIELED